MDQNSKELNLTDVRDTIVRWVYSCITVEQLEVLEKSAPDFIHTLFEKKEAPSKLEYTKGYIQGAIEFQKMRL